MEALHPRADPAAPNVRQLDPGDEGIEPLKLTEEDIFLAGKSLTAGAAAGQSGWTNSAIKAILLSRDHRAEMQKKVTALFNAMLRGDIPNQLWCIGRAVLLPKDDIGGIRPLGIGEAWYRFLGRAVIRKIGAEVGDQLRPLQLGIGISGGSEIAGRMAQLILDSGFVALKLDLKNAFNMIPRQHMLAGIREFCPQLIRWFHWAYGEATDLRLQDGYLICMSEVGSRQGDPLAGLCFCVGMQYALREIQKVVDRECIYEIEVAGIPRLERIEPLHGGLFAYIDDTTVYAPAEIANVIAEQLDAIFKTYGMQLAIPKCAFLGEEATAIIDPFFAVNSVGDVVMGAPTGTREFRKTKTEEMLAAMARPLEVIHELQPTCAYNVIKDCINARAHYLSRVGEASISGEAFAVFDRAVDKALIKVARGGVSDPHTEWDDQTRLLPGVMRSLPTKLGGLGIVRRGGIEGQKSNMLSRDLTTRFLDNCTIHCFHRGVEDWAPIEMGTGNNYFEQRLLPVLRPESGPPPAVAGPQNGNQTGPDAETIRPGDIVTVWYERVWHALHTKMASGSFREKTQAAWLLSSKFAQSGKWIGGRHGVLKGKHGLLETYFREAIRLRLFIPVELPMEAGFDNICQCGNYIDQGMVPYHFLDCYCSRATKIARHDTVQELLVNLMNNIDRHHATEAARPNQTANTANVGRLNPSTGYALRRTAYTPGGEQTDIAVMAGGHAQTAEQAEEMQFALAEGEQERAAARATQQQRWARGGTIMADIKFTSADRVHLVDVTIGDPAAPSYVRTGSALTEVHAANLLRDSKIAKYRSAVPALVAAGHFTAFALEATGRLGPDAIRFIDDIVPTGREDLKQRFYDQVAVVCMRFNCASIINRRGQLSKRRHVNGSQEGPSNNINIYNP
jgi:hypothetical protein